MNMFRDRADLDRQKALHDAYLRLAELHAEAREIIGALLKDETVNE